MSDYRPNGPIFQKRGLHDNFCVHRDGSCFFCEAVASPVSRLPATAYCPPAGDPSNRAGGTASHSQKRFPDGLTPVVAISGRIYDVFIKYIAVKSTPSIP